MFSRTPTAVAEHEATGQIAEIYHDIRRTLRVTGVNLNFRTWAAFDRFLPAMWSSMAPIAGTVAFEQAADAVRATGAAEALALPRLDAAAAVRLGESQRFQIARALELYHYINPKLLVFTVLVRRGLEQRSGAGASGAGRDLAPLAGGAPPRMAPMEMVDEKPSDRRLRALFRDIRKTMHLSATNSDYRTLALWPAYLDAAWRRLKPLVQSDGYARGAQHIAEHATRVAGQFPIPPGLTRDRLKRMREDPDRIAEVTRRFERLLPPLVLNVAILSRDWVEDGRLAASPFPPEVPS